MVGRSETTVRYSITNYFKKKKIGNGYRKNNSI